MSDSTNDSQNNSSISDGLGNDPFERLVNLLLLGVTLFLKYFQKIVIILGILFFAIIGLLTLLFKH